MSDKKRCTSRWKSISRLRGFTFGLVICRQLFPMFISAKHGVQKTFVMQRIEKFAEKWLVIMGTLHMISLSSGRRDKSVRWAYIDENALTCSRIDFEISSSTVILAGIAARTQASHAPTRLRTGISRIVISFSILREPRLCENKVPGVSGCTEVAKDSEDTAKRVEST